jgi:hypothetical protein
MSCKALMRVDLPRTEETLKRRPSTLLSSANEAAPHSALKAVQHGGAVLPDCINYPSSLRFFLFVRSSSSVIPAGTGSPDDCLLAISIAILPIILYLFGITVMIRESRGKFRVQLRSPISSCTAPRMGGRNRRIRIANRHSTVEEPARRSRYRAGLARDFRIEDRSGD